MVRDSIGAAAEIARKVGGFDGNLLLSGASNAFIHAMDVTLVVAAGVAMFGALLALAFLPARSQQDDEEGLTARDGIPVTGLRETRQ